MPIENRNNAQFEKNSWWKLDLAGKLVFSVVDRESIALQCSQMLVQLKNFTIFGNYLSWPVQIEMLFLYR